MKDSKHWSTHGAGVPLAEGQRDRISEEAHLEKNRLENSKSWDPLGVKG